MKHRGRKSAAEMAIISAEGPSTATVRRRSPRHRPPPPAHLTPATRAWWTVIVNDFDFEPFQLRTLEAAAEAWDRKEQARLSLTKHGLVYTDDKGMVRARPEVSIERDARVAYLRAIRELNLKVPEPSALRKAVATPPRWRNPEPWELRPTGNGRGKNANE